MAFVKPYSDQFVSLKHLKIDLHSYQNKQFFLDCEGECKFKRINELFMLNHQNYKDLLSELLIQTQRRNYGVQRWGREESGVWAWAGER